MTSSQHSRWFTGRTRLITVISFVAVGLAGAAAVSANIGILDATSSSNVGNASATGDLVTPSTQVIDVYLPATSTPDTAPAASAGVQEFTVDTAGTVAVATTATGLRLDSVTPTTGWTWSLTQTNQAELMVTMTNGTRTLEFVASTTGDGNVAASVNEPIVTQTPPVASNGGGYSDDDNSEYEGGEDDD